jgi:chromate transporter
MSDKRPTFREAFLFWLKLGFISFGGPAGQIAIMHREIVEKRRWVDKSQFLHALNFCMLLPGPEAQQLSTYLGWRLHGTRGGIAAGALFVLPSALILWALSYAYVAFGKVAWLSGAFDGLKPAVLAIVIAAVLRIGGKVLKNSTMWSLSAVSFIAIFALHIPFPAIIAAAGLIGYFGGKYFKEKFLIVAGSTHNAPEPATAPPPSLARTVRVLFLCLSLWWLPVVAVGAWLGWGSTHFQQALFFSKAAMVTFGGAYAVLPYVAQEAVQTHHWLSAPQMLDGLGLAETTPGPLIMVLQFVGFLGGWNHPGNLAPLASATLAAAITTWTTFLPCFLWIFLGAPYVERMRSNSAIRCVLSAITAAVVGVILNLAVWFGLQVIFPSGGKPDFVSAAIAAVAFIALHRWKWNVITIIVGAGFLGAAMKLAT